MAKNQTSKQPENVVVEYADLTGLLPWITQVAFFLSLGLVIARCTMMETLRDVSPVTPGSTVAPVGPGAASILFLNLLCCVPANLILLRRALDKTYYLHSSIAHILAGAVAIWAMVSTAWAGDKYAAFIHSSTLIAAAAMFWSATQVVRSWSRIRLVAATCFGILLICTSQGLIYRYLDLPDNIAQWKKIRTEELQRRGWAEDSFMAQQFERKLLNGEVIGFYSSSNTMAAMLVFMGIVTAGIATQRLSNRDEPGWAAAVMVGAAPALLVIWLTQSKTAYLTPAIATVLLFAVPRLRNWILARRKAAFCGAVVAILIAIAALIGHGIYHHSLPTDSLNFRWRFWTGSMGVFKSHPWIGTGWSNFGSHYLQFRLPEASEEIKDPHNFIVRFFCELGLVGGALAVLLLVRSAWEMTFPATPPGPSLKPKAPAKVGQSLRQVVPIILIGLMINIIASIDFHQDQYWVFLELMRRLLWLGLLVLAFATATFRSSKDAAIDDRPAPWVLTAILVAIAIFLLHNAVDFSMFENGPMMMLAMLGGTVIGARNAMKFGSRKRSMTAAYACGALVIGWLVATIGIAVPIAENEARMRDADQDVRQNNLNLAAAKYKDAFYVNPIRNTDFAIRAAEIYTQLPDGEAPFVSLTSEVIGRDPKDNRAQLLYARYFISRGQGMDKSTQVQKAYTTALSNDPNNVEVRLEYAQYLSTVFESQNAANQYELALKFDDGLDKAEPKRLNDEKKAEIRQKIKEIRGE